MRTYATLASIVLATTTGCGIDTTLPDLSTQFGESPTASGHCGSDVLTEFPPETLQMHVIDVGQGDAIWIRTPYFDDDVLESRNVLIDTGPPNWSEGHYDGGLVVVDYMTRFGHTYGDLLDAVVITHAHSDHYGGLPTIAETFFIDRYYGPTYVPSGSSLLNSVQSARTASDSMGSPFEEADGNALAASRLAPTDLFGPWVDADLLWTANTLPPGGNSNENDTSIVLSLKWSDRRILLMGDAEQHVEEQLLADHEQNPNFTLAAEVLKVGHHGSDTSSTDAFLDAVLGDQGELTWAIISSGRRSFGGKQLPATETVNKLKTHLKDFHLLSTENGDDGLAEGEEYGDDHIIVTIGPNGEVNACYAP